MQITAPQLPTCGCATAADAGIATAITATTGNNRLPVRIKPSFATTQSVSGDEDKAAAYMAAPLIMRCVNTLAAYPTTTAQLHFR